MKILLSILFTFGVMMSTSSLFADSCLLCGSGSSNGCQQCRGDRKSCEAKGCKVSGTGSCSTAANVKICKADAPEYDLTMLVPQAKSNNQKR